MSEIVPVAALYTNSNGQPVTHASYSSRQTFKHCPREFELTRVQGWWEKGNRAAPIFGKAIEAGVQAYEESGRVRGRGVQVFSDAWAGVKNLPDFETLAYTATEGSWEQLQRAGIEMQRLYELRVPYLPISTTPATLFQQVLRKKIFPGTHLDKLENKAILDMLTFPAWDHKAFPAGRGLHKCDNCAVRWSQFLSNGLEFKPCEQHVFRPLIVDIKTSGGDLDTHLVGLDPQLGEYAWQLRIPDVAFLWFVKAGHGLKKGSRVSLLRDAGQWGAGFELFVINVDDGTAKEPKHPADIYIGQRATLDDYAAKIKGPASKARTALEDAYLREGVVTGQLAVVHEQDITKQRIQFAVAHLSEQDMDETGRSVAQTTVEMVRAHEQGFYEKQPGIRFPNEKCNYCSMRWICLNQPEERDQHLSKRGEEWLDGVQGEE